MAFTICGKKCFPLFLQFATALPAIPLRVNPFRNLERPITPVERSACSRYFFFTKRRTMRVCRALFVGCSQPNHGLAANQSRLVRHLHSVPESLDYRIGIMTVHVSNDSPAICLEPCGHIFCEPSGYLSIDGNAVVIVYADELVELQRTCQRSGFVGNSFHQATISHDDPRAVIDNTETFAIERLGEFLLG